MSDLVICKHRTLIEKTAHNSIFFHMHVFVGYTLSWPQVPSSALTADWSAKLYSRLANDNWHPKVNIDQRKPAAGQLQIISQSYIYANEYN